MEKDVINNLKSLAIDMIDNAGSGHPGIALGCAPIMYTLYAKHLNVMPNDPKWINRDRFVLSAGHGSSLLYATLHMAGFDISTEDLKNFRRIGKTPGHPEVFVTPGVDASTGPLGQGLGNAVGMALASKIQNKKYMLSSKEREFRNKSLIDYQVYALCGDGDLMEGVANEAASLAGNWHLDNLIVLYDSNDVCLDGSTRLVFNENIPTKYEAMGWYTEVVSDGNSVDDIDKAISKAKEANRPALIIVRTKIGEGSLLEGTNEVHGKPLTKEDIAQLKAKLGVPEQPFFINTMALGEFKRDVAEHSNKAYEEWAKIYREYVNTELGGDSEGLNDLLGIRSDFAMPIEASNIVFEKEPLRDTNSKVLNIIASAYQNLIGGSADVMNSTKTRILHGDDIIPFEYKGRNINFGVREHAMGAIMNGLALSNFRVLGSTFLAFSDYMKPSIRMSALMGLPNIYIFTHDSISIGEDGPTHQPVEQLAMLRSIPNLNVYRPSDGIELLGSWFSIMNSKCPSALVVSKNEVGLLEGTDITQTLKGGYVVRKEKNKLYAIIIATGTELHAAVRIAEEFSRSYKLEIRVVSMVCKDLFQAQPANYQNEVLPKGYRNIVIEAGSSLGWEGFVYDQKYLITVDNFGISGKKSEVLKHMKYDYDDIRERIQSLLLR